MNERWGRRTAATLYSVVQSARLYELDVTAYLTNVLRQLPAIPPTELSTTDAVDLITTRIYAAVDTVRTVHDDVDAADPSSADLLHDIIHDLEKQAWMLKSENRKI